MGHIYDKPMVLSSALLLKMVEELKVRDGIDQMRLQILALGIEHMYSLKVKLSVEKIVDSAGYRGVAYDIPQCNKEYIQSLIDWIEENTKEENPSS